VENTQLKPNKETQVCTKPRVVVIGKHSYILENIIGILKREGLEPNGMLDDVDELAQKVLKMSFEVLLLGGGIDPHVRGSLISAVQLAKPECHIVEHFGGPATIISEISAALSR
jgi:hypothetical protein